MTKLDDMPFRLTVGVMAYNEEASLEHFMCELLSELADSDDTAEVLVIDDGSTDQTGQIADRFARDHANVSCVHHDANRGLGEVYRTVFDQAKGEYITCFPADGQFPPSLIPTFLSHFPAADMVLGYLPKRKSSWLAKTLSWTERVLYRLLLGPRPRHQGVFMFRRSILVELPLISTGPGFGIVRELTMRTYQGSYNVTSVPSQLRPRKYGRSKVNTLGNVWINLKQLFALWYQLRLRRR